MNFCQVETFVEGMNAVQIAERYYDRSQLMSEMTRPKLGWKVEDEKCFKLIVHVFSCTNRPKGFYTVTLALEITLRSWKMTVRSSKLIHL